MWYNDLYTQSRVAPKEAATLAALIAPFRESALESNAMATGIYVILNTKNGKVYIGKGKNIASRWKHHKRCLKGNYHYNVYLQRAWDKYGEKAFKFQVLEYCTVEQLDEREMHFIAVYKARGMAYNMTDGGDGVKGLPFSDEHRKNLSIAQKKRAPASIETRQKISIAAKNPSVETRKKMSDAKKNMSDETKRKIGEAGKGRFQSDEKRNKLRIANTGKTHSAETRIKIGNTSRGRTHTPEAKQKISEASRRYWEKKKAEKDTD